MGGYTSICAYMCLCVCVRAFSYDNRNSKDDWVKVAQSVDEIAKQNGGEKTTCEQHNGVHVVWRAGCWTHKQKQKKNATEPTLYANMRTICHYVDIDDDNFVDGNQRKCAQAVVRAAQWLL